MTAIDVKDLNVHFGAIHALKDVNVRLKSDRVTALIGPSGCGKTTFLRALNRMAELTPSARISGSVELDGQNIYRGDVRAETIRQQIGLILHPAAPLPMSVFDNVAFGLRVRGGVDHLEIAEKVEIALRRVLLWEKFGKRLNESALRLGPRETQCLCIARAIALDPSVLLLDQPADGLDPIETEAIEELIRELKSEFTIVFVTHSLKQAARVSDYTAYFFEGNLVEIGKTGTIFTMPKDRKTEDYISGRFG